MPACGSEGVRLNGCLWPAAKSGLASPRCLLQEPASPPRRATPRHHRPPPAPRSSRLRRLLRLGQRLLALCLLGPALWLAAWLGLLWLLLRLPLELLRRARAGPARGARCVLVTGGSTVQSVKLARGLRAAGARVVVAELEGPLGLARFSSSCSRYYALPRPEQRGVAAYVAALRDIVRREGVGLYVPVSPAGTGYLDALAKPYLEPLGCECLVPGTAELQQLVGPQELMRRARAIGLPTPRSRLLGSLEEAAGLYEGGRLRAPHLAVPAGPAGLRERPAELRLPRTLAEFLERRPRATGAWLLVRDPGGPHYLTCTTLRDSRLLANASCRLDEEEGEGGGALTPEERPEIARWLERFFSRGWGSGQAGLSGHLSFRLAASAERPGELVVISCRVGVGLPYLAQGAGHANLLLWRGCRHRWRSPEAAARPARAIDKREALFLYWDPLPYCVYCYVQLPFHRLADLLGLQHKPPLAVVR